MTTDATPTTNLNPSRQALNAVEGIRSLFAHPHDQGRARDKAKNRKLHDDDLLTLVLLALFQPLARSHRALSQISDLKSVQKRFAIRHASLGSISEAARIFDPELLRHVLAELIRHQPQAPRDPRPAALNRRLTASTAHCSTPCHASSSRPGGTTATARRGTSGGSISSWTSPSRCPTCST